MADSPTETLFPAESPGATDYKLVRFARAFRLAAITNPKLYVVETGVISQKHFLGEDLGPLIDNMVTRLQMVRDRLIDFGVWKDAIVGYFPLQRAPVIDDIIMVGVSDRPRTNMLPGLTVSPDAAKASDDGIKGQLVVDAFAKPGPVRPGRTVDTQIEVTLWDSNGNSKKLPGTMKVTLNVGPNAIEEVEGEFTAFKARLKSQMFWGVVTKVELSMKMSTKIDFDQSTARRLIGNWSSQVKSSLEFDLRVPKTAITIHVEGTLGVDQGGQPVWGGKFSLDF